jgi:ATP-binding cassette subfamily C protein LapB
MASFDVAKQLVERGGLIAMLLWACLWPVSGGPPSFDAIVTVMLLFDRMFEPVRHLHRLVDEGHERWTLCRDLLDILAVPPVSMRRIADPGHPLDADVEGLSFTYPGRDEPVLHNVSLRIAPGQHAAVVGRSGSGKSTLGRLLAGLLPPDQGSILIGGVDPFAQRGAAWLPPVGYMTQEPYIFAGTIFENVRFAHPDSTEDQVKAALILAGLPEMAETGRLHGQCLGQGGAGLSGGQKQRVMLARVLLLKPRFIIFDEPSSALDPYAAKRFFSDVLAALDGSTVLVITHHTSDLAWADVVLEFGDAGLSVHANIDTYRPSGSLTPSTALSLAIQ